MRLGPSEGGSRPSPTLRAGLGPSEGGSRAFPTLRAGLGPSEGGSRAFPTLRADLVAMPLAPGGAKGERQRVVVDTKPVLASLGKGSAASPGGPPPALKLRGRVQNCETS